jgi:DNA-binding transcriptional regulator YhcF (GntR family)
MLHVIKKMRIWKRIEAQVVNEKLPSIRQALDLSTTKRVQLHAIRAERKRLNDAAGLTSTKGNGTYVDVKKVIVESIKRHKPVAFYSEYRRSNWDC